MSNPDLPLDDRFVLYDVSPSMFSGLSRILPEDGLRYFTVQRTLKLDRSVFENVAWHAYEAVIDAFNERRFRHTYLDGTLELKSTAKDDEWTAKVLGRLTWMTAYRFHIPIKSVGTTTRTQKEKRCGLEPDDSYYLQHERKVRGRRSTAAVIEGPPPDLAMEVETSNPAISRLEVYARLGVPEVWKCCGDRVEFLELQTSGEYEIFPVSTALPMVSSNHVSRALGRLNDIQENAVIDEFLESLTN